MQVSRGLHPEVAPQGVVWTAAARLGGGVPLAGGAEGMEGGGGAFDARSRAHAADGATEVFGGQRDGVHQREEREPQRSVIWGTKGKLHGATLLGTWILGSDGRQGRGWRASIHRGAGEGGSTRRSTGVGGALSASR
mgnify:CR=1 FL=1